MPDQRGKIIVVTGGNSGTGYATCKAFYDRGATVYLAARSEQKAKRAIADIKDGKDFDVRGRAVGTRVPDPGRIEYLQLDLADLHSVEAFAVEFGK
jgi:NAD(P)-dependent dehydrogenase (short-subunit alcohol dehydrogenase family)